jgi:hypothetical protein
MFSTVYTNILHESEERSLRVRGTPEVGRTMVEYQICRIQLFPKFTNWREFHNIDLKINRPESRNYMK